MRPKLRSCARLNTFPHLHIDCHAYASPVENYDSRLQFDDLFFEKLHGTLYLCVGEGDTDTRCVRVCSVEVDLIVDLSPSSWKYVLYEI